MKDLKTISDEALVEIIRSTDRELFAEVIERYEKKLLRYASYLIHDSDRAADAVQESFIKAFINLNIFDTKKKFSSWIYRIVHNEVMNALKKHKSETPLLETMDFTKDDDTLENISDEELKRDISECLNSLSTRYAEPLSLFFLEEKSYEEISAILRLPMGTVATRINRAKKLMKKICQIKLKK